MSRAVPNVSHEIPCDKGYCIMDHEGAGMESEIKMLGEGYVTKIKHGGEGFLKKYGHSGYPKKFMGDWSSGDDFLTFLYNEFKATNNPLKRNFAFWWNHLKMKFIYFSLSYHTKTVPYQTGVYLLKGSAKDYMYTIMYGFIDAGILQPLYDWWCQPQTRGYFFVDVHFENFSRV